jgi:hypothetical protein
MVRNPGKSRQMTIFFKRFHKNSKGISSLQMNNYIVYFLQKIVGVMPASCAERYNN